MKVGHVEFSWDECFWSAQVALPSWRGFQSRRGPYGSVDRSAPSDGVVEHIFAPEGRGEEPLTAWELAIVQWLLDRETAVCSAALDAVYGNYEQLREAYGFEEEERTEFMPDLRRKEDLTALIGLHSVHVHQISGSGVPYVGFELGCTWDPEHELGVLMHGTRVVEVGGADTAMLLWIAERDAGRAT